MLLRGDKYRRLTTTPVTIAWNRAFERDKGWRMADEDEILPPSLTGR